LLVSSEAEPRRGALKGFPSPAKRERVRVRACLCPERIQDRLQHTIEVVPYFLVLKPDHPISCGPEVRISSSITPETEIMRLAVQLDYEPSLDADKINEVRTDRPLATELVAAKTSIAELRP
jgi:hypothetical protein